MRVGAEAKQYIDNLLAQGEVPITPERLEGWEAMTDEERQQDLLRRFKADEAGVSLQGPVRGASSPAAGPAPDSDTFDPDDPSAILTGRAERYRMPNGRWVWAHPCSIEEAVTINARATTITGERRNLGRDDPRWNSQEVRLERHLRAQVLQVIHCCRRGQDATSPATFDPLKHVEWLMREPGYVDAIQEIVVLSNSLGQGAGEAAALKEAMIGFFARLQSFAETWHGRLTEDCCPALLRDFANQLEDCAISASSMKQPESLSPEAWFAWNIVLRDAPAEV